MHVGFSVIAYTASTCTTKQPLSSAQVGCMQVILSWHSSAQQLSWSVLTVPGAEACGAPSMNWDTTNREAAGSFHHTPQSVHATCGQCMCMKRCWESTGDRWSKSVLFLTPLARKAESCDKFYSHLFYPLFAFHLFDIASQYSHFILFIPGSSSYEFRRTKETSRRVC